MLEHIIINGLVVFVVAYMLHHLDGPLDVFLKIRKLVGIIDVPVLNDDGNVVDRVREVADKPLAKLVACFWCLSTWVSLASTILYGLAVHLSWWQYPILWLASTAISGIINERI